MADRDRVVWTRQRTQYERRGYEIMSGGIRKALADFPYRTITRQNYREVVINNIRRDLLLAAIEQLYRFIILTHGRRMAERFDELKREAGMTQQKAHPFLNRILSNLLAALLREYAGRKIVIMERSLAGHLIDLIAELWDKGEGERSQDDVIRELKKEVEFEGFYKWQIERIVRTEATFTANRAAIEGARVAPVLLKKRWLTVLDSRTRELDDGDKFDHAEMQGDVKNLEAPFAVPMDDGGTENLDYPGHPIGSAGNVINCRCGLGFIPVMDADGLPIPNPNYR